MIRKGSFLDLLGRITTTLVIGVILSLAIVGALTVFGDVYDISAEEALAAVPMATPAPPDPPGECFEWMVAGVQMIHKCIDEDEEIACYAPVGGVLQCLARN